MNGERRHGDPARVVEFGWTAHGHGVHAHRRDLAAPLARRSSVLRDLAETALARARYRADLRCAGREATHAGHLADGRRHLQIGRDDSERIHEPLARVSGHGLTRRRFARVLPRTCARDRHHEWIRGRATTHPAPGPVPLASCATRLPSGVEGPEGDSAAEQHHKPTATETTPREERASRRRMSSSYQVPSALARSIASAICRGRAIRRRDSQDRAHQAHQARPSGNTRARDAGAMRWPFRLFA